MIVQPVPPRPHYRSSRQDDVPPSGRADALSIAHLAQLSARAAPQGITIPRLGPRTSASPDSFEPVNSSGLHLMSHVGAKRAGRRCRRTDPEWYEQVSSRKGPRPAAGRHPTERRTDDRDALLAQQGERTPCSVCFPFASGSATRTMPAKAPAEPGHGAVDPVAPLRGDLGREPPHQSRPVARDHAQPPSRSSRGVLSSVVAWYPR